jgi:hypothetical protein
VAVGDPGLLSVDHERAVGTHVGADTHRRDVAAGVGFAQQLAPDVLAAPDRRQVGVLLLLGAEPEEDVGRQVDLIDGAGGAGPEDLLGDDEVLQRVVIGATTVLDRPGGADEAALPQHPEPVPELALLLR